MGVGNTPCTPADVAAAASNAVHIYYGIALLPRGQPEVSFKDCEGEYPIYLAIGWNFPLSRMTTNN